MLGLSCFGERLTSLENVFLQWLSSVNMTVVWSAEKSTRLNDERNEMWVEVAGIAPAENGILN